MLHHDTELLASRVDMSDNRYNKDPVKYRF